MRTLVAYVPVLHEGYLRFFKKYDGPKELYLFGPELIAADKALSKDIRQLEPSVMRQAIEGLGIFERVEILNKSNTAELAGKDLLVPDEDIVRDLVAQNLPQAKVEFDSIFLRWDKHNAAAEKELMPNRTITHDEFAKKIMGMLEAEATKSSDFWRHVAGAIVKDGTVVLVAHNTHVPSPHSPYAHGDPRSLWSRGVKMELATGFHAEVSLIAEAAKCGVALAGADLYVTTFPCPPCSKAVAHSGIKHLYVGGGNSILDAQEVIQAAGIKIIYVE